MWDRQDSNGARLGLALALVALTSIWSPEASRAEAGDSEAVTFMSPHQRPAGAPMIAKVQKDSGWYDTALVGVSRPYPYSLRFLEDQGPWYTPFSRPGMPGPYDLRGWHRGTEEPAR